MVALCLAVMAQAEVEPTLDSNTAFYEGESLNYVIYPPEGYQMVDWEATADGYSFAFIPKGQTYDKADLMIGANIFKIRGLKFEEVVTSDTTAIREHYGKDVSIWLVDSVFTASGQLVPTFFINDPAAFIPNVMISYVDGQTELLIFELIITTRVARIKAEDVLIECLEKLKVLPSAELGYE
jgi:hypothetical protein